MKIAIGTINPAKVTAVRSVIERVWPLAELIPLPVPSGIREMPLSDSETRQGAYNRARAARDSVDADLGLGLEGGVHSEAFGLVLLGWVVALHRDGRSGIGGCPRLQLPDPIARRVLGGEELGPVMDDILGTESIRTKEGAVGALTGNLMVRGDAFAAGLTFALAPFVMPELYEDA